MAGASMFRTSVTTVGFLFIAAFFLFTEHRAHLFGMLPYLFLLACPLLHMFGHGGHGGHGGHAGHGSGPGQTVQGDPRARAREEVLP